MRAKSEGPAALGFRESIRGDWERIKGWLGIEPGRLGRRFLILAALLWAIEWFVIQEWTFDASYRLHQERDEYVRSLFFRGTRNLAFALGLLFTLPRLASAFAFLVWSLFASVAVAYHSVFQRALGFQTLKASFREGAAVADAGLALLNAKLLFGLLVLAVVKVALVWRNRSRFRPRWRVGFLFLFTWVGLGIWGDENVLRLGNLVRHVSFEEAAAAYGYLWTWAGEEVHIGGRLLERALEVAERSRSNRLSDELPLPYAEKIAIIQMESVEFRSLDLEFEGEPLMPFLAELRKRSRFYKVRAIHENGSADADFAMLTGKAPSPDVIPYRIEGYPYENPLPSLFRRAGYRTEFYHGLYGHFFHRRPIIEKSMGFDSVVFEEELIERYGALPTHWGVKDRDVFRLAAKEMNASEGPVFQFIITLTSHVPFDFLSDDEREISPRVETPQDKWETIKLHYLDSIRYVDRVLREYYEALPEGSLVILYGDHATSAIPGNFRDPEGNVIEYVPYFIHQKGALLETADPDLALGGTLGQIDLVTYIHDYARSLAEHSRATPDVATRAASRSPSP